MLVIRYVWASGENLGLYKTFAKPSIFASRYTINLYLAILSLCTLVTLTSHPCLEFCVCACVGKGYTVNKYVHIPVSADALNCTQPIPKMTRMQRCHFVSVVNIYFIACM